MKAFGSTYRKNLTPIILIAIVFGVFLGGTAPDIATATALIGDLFIQSLKILIVPIIVISMIAGIVNLDETANLGRLGLKTVVFYTATTAIAVVTGLICVNVIQPGKGHVTADSAQPVIQSKVDHDSAAAPTNSEGGLGQVVRNIIPSNVVEAAAEGNVLGLIFFSIFLGIALLHVKHQGFPVIRDGVGCCFEALIWMVDKIMLIAPIGIMSLVSVKAAEFIGSGMFEEFGTELARYGLTVVMGLLVHGVFSLSLILVVFKRNPFQFALAMLPAVSTAFSTASSAATLPITIDALEHRAGVPNRYAGFVAPLGATVNMDGTAIYEAVAAVFIANWYGVDLTLGQQGIIFLTATFSAIGAAGIPGAGLIMMTMVLASVGLPVEGIGLIVAIDRPLDMLRTAVNVWGDSIGAAVIAASEEASETQ